MWRRACALLIGVLIFGLVLTRRRLRDAEAELDRLRAQTSGAGKGPTAAVSAEPPATDKGAAPASGGETAEGATVASDMSSEWEQAVPPMDS